MVVVKPECLRDTGSSRQVSVFRKRAATITEDSGPAISDHTEISETIVVKITRGDATYTAQRLETGIACRLYSSLQKHHTIRRPDQKIGVSVAFGINDQHSRIRHVPTLAYNPIVIARLFIFR